jgi:hypothetical protein
MKGPGMRLDLDVRRHWQCPACGTERHTPGKVTFVRCHFCKDHPAMQLVEHQRPLRDPPPPLDLIIDLHPEDVDAPAFVPAHLREPEPAVAAETITEILHEPPAEAEQPARPAAVSVVDEPEEEPTATAPEEAAPEQTREPKRKKRRGRRQRRRNRSNPSAGEGEAARQTGSGQAGDAPDSSVGSLNP